MFYDVFCKLCKDKGVKATNVALDIGVSRGTATKWKNGSMPNGDTLQKIADYFSVTVDFLLNGENSSDDADKITYDDFTYAMYGHSKELTEEQKQLLLKLAEDMRGRRGL